MLEELDGVGAGDCEFASAAPETASAPAAPRPATIFVVLFNIFFPSLMRS